MIIYKITNIKNKKVYIGQTTKSVEERFRQHIYTAINNITDTHLAKAIRKYGQESFTINIIDTANSKEELDKKEIFWIKKYNSTKTGYNMTENAIGGNTYQNLSQSKLHQIAENIREQKMFGKNPQSKKIKCKNIISDKEIIFMSLSEAKEFFNEKTHSFVSRRITGKTKCLYKQQWLFSYLDTPYPEYTINKNNHRKRKIKLISINDNKEFVFDSFTEASKFLNFNTKLFSKYIYQNKYKDFIFKNSYKVIVLS